MMDFSRKIEEIKKKGLYRNIKYVESKQGPNVIINGKNVILLSSNDYLGLCSDERLKKYAIDSIKMFGVGSGGSRLTSGSFIVHQQLEELIAEFKESEAAIVFNTGYMANLGTISALVDKNWTIFCDRLNHASIIDGCMLGKAKIVVYKHCDIVDLEKKIKRYGNINSIIITDSVFSMDGDLAPLNEIVEIAKKYSLITMVDDAHGTGVIGKSGRGAAEFFNLHNKIDIMVGTFSKALASEGGFVTGKKDLIDYLKQKSKAFIYSTSLSPHTTAVSMATTKLLMTDTSRVKTLQDNVSWFRNQLKGEGLDVIKGITPIIPIIIGDTNQAVEISDKLFDLGIFVPAIRPPTVPKGTSRLRISIMATHEKKDLKYVVESIKSILGITNK